MAIRLVTPTAVLKTGPVTPSEVRPGRLYAARVCGDVRLVACDRDLTGETQIFPLPDGATSDDIRELVPLPEIHRVSVDGSPVRNCPTNKEILEIVEEHQPETDIALYSVGAVPEERA